MIPAMPSAAAVPEPSPEVAVVAVRGLRVALRTDGRTVHLVRDVSFADVGGLERQIDLVRELVQLPLQYPQVYRQLGISAPRGILFYGPPGAGKTHLARAVANEIDARYFGPSAQRRQSLIAQLRDGTIDEADLPTDLVTMLYLHWDPEWDEQLPLREVCVFLMAATQTTSQSFPHLIIQLEQWLSDHPDELDAAVSAGWSVLGLARPGEPNSPRAPHRWIDSFTEVDLQRL